MIQRKDLKWLVSVSEGAPRPLSISQRWIILNCESGKATLIVSKNKNVELEMSIIGLLYRIKFKDCEVKAKI